MGEKAERKDEEERKVRRIQGENEGGREVTSMSKEGGGRET